MNRSWGCRIHPPDQARTRLGTPDRSGSGREVEDSRGPRYRQRAQDPQRAGVETQEGTRSPGVLVPERALPPRHFPDRALADRERVGGRLGRCGDRERVRIKPGDRAVGLRRVDRSRSPGNERRAAVGSQERVIGLQRRPPDGRESARIELQHPGSVGALVPVDVADPQMTPADGEIGRRHSGAAGNRLARIEIDARNRARVGVQRPSDPAVRRHGGGSRANAVLCDHLTGAGVDRRQGVARHRYDVHAAAGPGDRDRRQHSGEHQNEPDQPRAAAGRGRRCKLVRRTLVAC